MQRIKHPRFVFTMVLVLTLVLSALPAGAQDEHQAPLGNAELYRLDHTPQTPEGLARVVADAQQQFSITLEPARVAENPEKLTLELPFGPQLEAYREHFVVYGPDWKSWSGALHYPGASTPSGHAVLVYHGDHVSGIVNFEKERYQLVKALDGGQRLVRLHDQTTPVCGLHAFHRGEEKEEVNAPAAVDRTLDFSPDAPLVAAQASTRIDVLALYTKDFFAFPTSEVGVINFVQDSISIANSSFINSNISAHYNLVYVGALLDAQPPNTGIFDGWQWLNGNPAEMVALRNSFGADMVALFVPFIYDDDNFCGVANLPRQNGTIVGGIPGLFGDRAYSVQRDGCGLNDITFAHELGHNYGMRHDTENTSTSHLFRFGRGHVFPVGGTTKASIMGCFRISGPISGAVCNRIPHFSDPAITYSGVPTGTSTRNNAAVGRTQKGPYSNFRPVSGNSPPNATFTVSCGGGTCTFNASGSSDPGGSIVQYRWDFGDGTTQNTSSSTVNHTYTFGSFFWVHLTVVDNGGQRDFNLAIATP